MVSILRYHSVGYPVQRNSGGLAYPTQPAPGNYPTQQPVYQPQYPAYHPQYPQNPQPYPNMNPQVPYGQPGYGQPPPPYPGMPQHPVPQVTHLSYYMLLVNY